MEYPPLPKFLLENTTNMTLVEEIQTKTFHNICRMLPKPTDLVGLGYVTQFNQIQFLLTRLLININRKKLTYLMMLTGRNMLDRISEPQIMAKVVDPRAPSELIVLCKLEVPQNAVKCIMNANPITTTFLVIRMFSLFGYVGEVTSLSFILGFSSRDSAVTVADIIPPVCSFTSKKSFPSAVLVAICLQTSSSLSSLICMRVGSFSR